MKMNIPCRVLKIVKRYAITMEDSLRKNKPKDHVSPNRKSRANAPNTHDLWKRKKRNINKRKKQNNGFHLGSV